MNKNNGVVKFVLKVSNSVYSIVNIVCNLNQWVKKNYESCLRTCKHFKKEQKEIPELVIKSEIFK